MNNKLWAGLILAALGSVAQATSTTLLADNFQTTTLDASKWTAIKATGPTNFDESTVGNTLSATSGYMYIQNQTLNAGGAYKSKLLPVNELGEINIERGIWLVAGGSQLAMPDEIITEDGTVLLRWGYQNTGFGGFNDTQVSPVWTETDEVITYDPITGHGTYSIAGGASVTISGTPLPAGTTNLYLRGSAYSGDSTSNWKAFQDFTVSQVDYQQLTVSSTYGAPSPERGDSVHPSGSEVNCSVTNVVYTGGWGTPFIRYECTGWAGTGSVPASGTTNAVAVTLDEDSSITWTWEPLDTTLTVSTYIGSPSPAVGIAPYAIGSNVTCSVQNERIVDGIRYVCSGWVGTGSVPASGTTNSVSFTIGQTSSISWIWQNLDSELTVVSAYGDPAPAVGEEIYPEGTVVTCTVENAVGSASRHFCTGWQTARYVPIWNMWSGIASGTNNWVDLTLADAVIRLTWLWETDHWLEVQIEGSGTVSRASGFCDEGSAQTLIATPTDGWVFDGWSGDASGTDSAALTMNTPKNVIAQFSHPASITNLSVAQVAGERKVEVSYDVAGTRPLLVNLEVLQNGTNLTPYLYGELGMISPGTNHVITWNAQVDWNYNVDELTFNLLTEDGLPFYAPYDLDAPSLVPQTGQTNDFGYAETDGDLRPGLEWPEPRFTDNGDNTITDHLTGLMWSKNQTAASWSTAMQNCDNLTLATHTDWRLPNVRELRSLLSNFSRYSPVLELNVFNMSSSATFWTSTIFEYSPSYAYGINISAGTMRPETVSQTMAYFSVRGVSDSPVRVPKTGQIYSHSSLTSEDGDLQLGEAWPTPRFSSNGDGTVIDNLTGLMWVSATSSQHSWYAARSSCAALSTAGHTDWRLPSVLELESLIDYGKKYPTPMLPTGHLFTGVNPGSSEIYYYWTATTFPGSSGYAYKTAFYDGRTQYYSKNNPGVFLACRGGVEIQKEIPEPAGQYPLPHTGQTNSYASGDDGEIQTGIPIPNLRFTQIGIYVIRDNLTGLVWFINMAPQQDYWQNAVSYADSYVNTYDWRLPNLREMQSLMDLSQSNPALPEGHPFQNVQTNVNYWTSTSLYTNGASYAWQVNMADGGSSVAQKWTATGNGYAMVYGPVISPQAYVHKTGQTTSYFTQDDGAWQSGTVQFGDRFTDNGNYTISDNRTGLMWLKAVTSVDKMTWAEAVEYCENLNYGGCTDWRLPNARELESLADYSRGGSQTVLPEGHPFSDIDLRFGSFFWTSSTLNSNPEVGISMGLTMGGLSGSTKDMELNVWPVRGGN